MSFLHSSGGRELRDEYGFYDGLNPHTAILTVNDGLAVAIYMQKPPSQEGRNPQEIHLLRLRTPPTDISDVYHSRTGSGGEPCA